MKQKNERKQKLNHSHHHLNVATKEDPATARRGENFYFYFIRCVINSVISSWNIEKNILDRKRINIFSFQNRMIHYFVLEFLQKYRILIHSLEFFLLLQAVSLLYLEKINVKN